MKRVSALEYLRKKNIIEDLENGKYTSTVLISDEEFDRINSKLDEYHLTVSEFNQTSLTPEQQTIIESLVIKIHNLEQTVEELRQVAYDEVNINEGTMDVTNIQ